MGSAETRLAYQLPSKAIFSGRAYHIHIMSGLSFLNLAALMHAYMKGYLLCEFWRPDITEYEVISCQVM